MSIIITIVHLALLTLFVWKYAKNLEEYKTYFFSGLIIKIGGGLLLGLLYYLYYGFGDTISFYQKASDLADLAFTDIGGYFNYLAFNEYQEFKTGYEFQPRALFFIKIVSVLAILTFNNYWLISMYLSGLCFLAIWSLAKTLIKFFGSHEAVFFSLLFIPSVAIWSSGLIKETLALAAICIYIKCIVEGLLIRNISISGVVAFVLSAVLLWTIKYYYAAVLFLFSFAFIITYLVSSASSSVLKTKTRATVFYIFLALLATLTISQFHPNFYLSRFLDVIVTNNALYQNISNPGDFIQYHDLTNTWSSVLLNSPKALFSGLFRPFLGESSEAFKILYGFENLLIMTLILMALKPLPKNITIQSYLIVLTVILIVVTLTVFLSLSAPNYGTLIRYRTGFLPFLMLLGTMNNAWLKKTVRGVFE